METLHRSVVQGREGVGPLLDHVMQEMHKKVHEHDIHSGGS